MRCPAQNDKYHLPSWAHVIQKKLDLINEVMMPGIHSMTPKFELKYSEVDVMSPTMVGSFDTISCPADHMAETNPMSLRNQVAGKLIAYTGDGAWTRYTPEVAEGADLFICECYFYESRLDSI